MSHEEFLMNSNRASMWSMEDVCTIQGSLVVVANTGILITGRPGAGKSIATLDLGLKGHGVVCDELVRLNRSDSGVLSGEPVDCIPLIEVRGLGIFRLADLVPEVLQPSSEIGLVVELTEFEPGRDLGRTDPEMDEFDLLGVSIPRFRVPVATGVSPGLLIEILVRLHIKKCKEQSER